MNTRIPVTVIGATGVVGQRFTQRLAQHPEFEIRHLAASSRSAGKSYADACTWRLGSTPYAGLAHQKIVESSSTAAMAPLVFSALDAGVAGPIEEEFARAGATVFSNASAHRMDEDVPLLVPEVNPEHLDLLPVQRQRRGWSGAILCNPNCTTTVLVMALAPLHRAFGLEAFSLVSMQAVSGSGYPGVASLDILGNVLPYIAGEEEKVEEEAARLLGSFNGKSIDPAIISSSAQCHRVPVIDGHTEAVSVKLHGNPTTEEIIEVLSEWRAAPQELGLTSAPPSPLVIHNAPDRPQVVHDVTTDGGMSVHVGRIRPCSVLGTKFVLLGHNTERGAAGGSVLNAELAVARGLINS